MATTTNYGWTTPDDTALVKDGAAAIRSLGTAIDTSFAADEGDLLVGGTSDIFEALPIGAVGTVLTSDGDTAEWAAPASGGMTLLSTTTLSAAVTTISGISQDYNSLFILVYGVSNNTGDRTFNMRPNGSESISTLVYQYGTTDSAGVDSVYRLSAGQDTTRTNTNNAYGIYIHNYTSTTNYKPTSFSGQFRNTVPADIAVIGGGSIATNSAITSLGFDAQGSVTFSSGTVLIYGVK
jgi:hypothetical protein